MKHYYFKTLLLFFTVLFCTVNISAQTNKSLWTKISKNNVSRTELVIRKSEPSKASYFKLDINGLKNILRNAPKRKGFTGVSNVIVSFPNADGSLESYRILEAPVLHPTLQAKHPNLQSYIGQSIDSPSTIIRFSITPQGLHTMTLSSNKGAQFIDPYSKGNNSYIIYSKKDLPRLKDEFICGVTDAISANKNNRLDFESAKNANDGILREYDLALAFTIEYADFHVQAAGAGGDTEDAKKDVVLAAMMVTMVRVNGIFERDLSVRMNIIVNNKDIIFINSDSFDNNDAINLIGESQFEINAAIGAANYDIGHTFSTGGGGLASNGVCIDAIKARGITGSSAPVGDAYDIDFVAHEIGHQFGANHTFNGNTGNCAAPNRNASTAYEPGSGTTIMAYAGICSPQNVQSNSDAYFHQASLLEIWTYISGTSCADETATGNGAPTAIAGNDYTIPISTPYKLSGNSTDTEAINTHTYTWEQYDLGDAGLPMEGDLSEGPLVRTFEGTTDPVRFIPRLADVISNGGISTTWEKLASISRAINFQLTVRDNDIAGGQTDSDGMLITTDTSAGPFSVTSQASTGISWPVGSTQTVTWDKANTDLAPVNTANVNIWLSTDAGLTFAVPLATGVPNNGSYEISSVPNNIGPFCRVMVEGANNIFYNVNTVNFAVGYSVITTCNQYPSTNPAQAIDDNGGGFTQTDGISVPLSVTITDINIGVNISHTRIGDLLLAVLSPDGNQISLINPGDCGNENDLILKFDDDGDTFDCANSGTNQVFQSFQESLSLLNGEESSGTWTLGVGDFAAGQTGTLNSWYVEVCTTAINPLGLDEFDLDSFSIFPNPNNGEFTVRLNSNSSENIKMSVYDIRGRRVFDNIYRNTSNFNEVINLGSVQSGLYILKVTDGNKSGTKKIIIK